MRQFCASQKSLNPSVPYDAEIPVAAAHWVRRRLVRLRIENRFHWDGRHLGRLVLLPPPLTHSLARPTLNHVSQIHRRCLSLSLSPHSQSVVTLNAKQGYVACVRQSRRRRLGYELPSRLSTARLTLTQVQGRGEREIECAIAPQTRERASGERVRAFSSSLPPSLPPGSKVGYLVHFHFGICK